MPSDEANKGGKREEKNTPRHANVNIVWKRVCWTGSKFKRLPRYTTCTTMFTPSGRHQESYYSPKLTHRTKWKLCTAKNKAQHVHSDRAGQTGLNEVTNSLADCQHEIRVASLHKSYRASRLPSFRDASMLWKFGNINFDINFLGSPIASTRNRYYISVTRTEAGRWSSLNNYHSEKKYLIISVYSKDRRRTEEY